MSTQLYVCLPASLLLCLKVFLSAVSAVTEFTVGADAKWTKIYVSWLLGEMTV